MLEALVKVWIEALDAVDIERELGVYPQAAQEIAALIEPLIAAEIGKVNDAKDQSKAPRASV